MKVALIFHPLKLCFTPFQAIAIICNELKKHGFDVKIFDINADFTIKLKSKKMKENLIFLYSEVLKLQKDINNAIFNISEFNYLYENHNRFLYLINNYNKMVNTFKNKNVLKNSKKILEYRREVHDLYYIINKLIKFVYSLNNSDLKNNVEEIINSLLKKVYKFNPNLVGISLQYNLFNGSQIFSYIISNLIKRKCNSTIFLGGSDINDKILNERTKRSICNLSYADYIIYGYSEEPVINLANALKNNKNINIKNVIDINNFDNTTQNIDKSMLPKDFTQTKSDWSGIDFKKYFIPEMCIPIEISRGCYWNRCQFCIHTADGIKYKVKNVDDVIDEIKEIINLYGIHYFTLGTNSLHPSFANEFSQKIIENNLKIYYGTFIRFEKQFNRQLLEQMYNSGLRYCAWGFESGSQRMLDLYDKGTNLKIIQQIIRNSHELGICNILYLLMGLLGENEEDVQLTIDFIKQNIEYIDAICKSIFTLQKRLLMFNNPKRFGYDEKTFEKMVQKPFNPKNYINILPELFKNKPFQFLNETVLEFLFDHSIWANSQLHP